MKQNNNKILTKKLDNKNNSEKSRAILFDASSLISFSLNGLFPEFRELKKIFGGHFIITESVKKEVIDNPIQVKKFELEALRLRELLQDGVLELPDVLGVSNKEITSKMNEMMSKANSIFVSKSGDIKLIHDGETSCMALSKIIQEKIDHVLCIDERTARMLIERPDNLEELLERKMHTNIKLQKSNFEIFKDFKIIRSTELIYIAYKKGIVKMRDPQILDALLYALKFKGCSISDDEIAEIKKIK